MKDLERKYNEAEKVFVYGIFQTANLTPEQLAELIRSKGTFYPRSQADTQLKTMITKPMKGGS